MPHCLRLFAEVLGEVAASEFFVAIGCLEQRFAADVTARVFLVEKDDAKIAVRECAADVRLNGWPRSMDQMSRRSPFFRSDSAWFCLNERNFSAVMALALG